MTEEEHLCVSCGMCCDGTLFGSVELLPDDDQDQLRTLGASIEAVKEDGKSTFKLTLGCQAHVGGYCQVYATRPSICRGFKCKLLQSVEHDQISLSQAKQHVVDARALQSAMRKAAESVDPKLAKRTDLEIAKFCSDILSDKGTVEQRRRYAAVTVEAMALMLFNKEHFLQD